jgi:hypothetical protein
LLIHPDGEVELQAPVQPLECPDTANFHKHDEVQSVHRIDHDFKARVEELCAVGVKPKQIMQQLLQDGRWGTLDDRVEQQVIGIRKRFFTSRTPLGRKNTYADLLQWFKQIEVRHTHHVLCAAALHMVCALKYPCKYPYSTSSTLVSSTP